jgi:hypothetical protein
MIAIIARARINVPSRDTNENNFDLSLHLRLADLR